MGIGSTNVAITADNAPELIAGDALSDASDGTVESHTRLDHRCGPDQAGPESDHRRGRCRHTHGNACASYGTIDGSSTRSARLVGQRVQRELCRPSVHRGIQYSDHERELGHIPGHGADTPDDQRDDGRDWTVDGLKSAAARTLAPSSSTVAVGQIPNFPVDKSSITSGSILKLKVLVDPLGLIPAAANYAFHEVTQTLITPDPKITKTGCANAGDACVLTGGSIAGTTSGWTMTWTLLKNGQQVGNTFTGNPFTPSITEAGTYTVSLAATTSVFSGNASLPPFTVAAALCTTPPTEFQMSIATPCAGGCDTNQTITIKGDPSSTILKTVRCTSGRSATVRRARRVPVPMAESRRTSTRRRAPRPSS